MPFLDFKSPHDSRISAKRHEKLFENEKPESVPNLNLRPICRKPDAPDSSATLTDTLHYFEDLASVDDTISLLLKHLDDLCIAVTRNLAQLLQSKPKLRSLVKKIVQAAADAHFNASQIDKKQTFLHR